MSLLIKAKIFVWQVELDQPIPIVAAMRQLLSTDEQQRADRFRRESDRTHFTITRGVLRLLLGQLLDKAPQQICFAYGQRGKPYLAEPDAVSGLQFNVSHSQGLALLALGYHRRIGVDIEQRRSVTDVEQLAQRFFSDREYGVIASLPPEQRLSAFLRGWTCKEAFLKAIGTGVAHLESVEVALHPSEPARFLHLGDEAIDRWTLKILEPHPDYAAALVVELVAGQAWELISQKFQFD